MPGGSAEDFTAPGPGAGLTRGGPSMLFDSHAHLDMAEFDVDLAGVMSRASAPASVKRAASSDERAVSLSSSDLTSRSR